MSSLLASSANVLYNGIEVFDDRSIPISMNSGTRIPVDCSFRCLKIRSITFQRPGCGAHLVRHRRFKRQRRQRMERSFLPIEYHPT